MPPEKFDKWLCFQFGTAYGTPVFLGDWANQAVIAELEGHTYVKPGESDGSFKPMGRREFRKASRLPGY